MAASVYLDSTATRSRKHALSPKKGLEPQRAHLFGGRLIEGQSDRERDSEKSNSELSESLSETGSVLKDD